jgi:hypothetical protein
LFEDHVIGEVLGLGGSEVLTLNSKLSIGRGKLEYLIRFLGDLGGRERNKGPHGRSGGDKRNELGVHKFYGVGFSGKVGVEDFLTDGKGLFGGRLLSTFEFGADGVLTTFEVANSLLSYKDEVNIKSLSNKLLVTRLSLLDHEGVVSSTETTISSD